MPANAHNESELRIHVEADAVPRSNISPLRPADPSASDPRLIWHAADSVPPGLRAALAAALPGREAATPDEVSARMSDPATRRLVVIQAAPRDAVARALAAGQAPEAAAAQWSAEAQALLALVRAHRGRALLLLESDLRAAPEALGSELGAELSPGAGLDEATTAPIDPVLTLIAETVLARDPARAALIGEVEAWTKRLLPAAGFDRTDPEAAWAQHRATAAAEDSARAAAAEAAATLEAMAEARAAEAHTADLHATERARLEERLHALQEAMAAERSRLAETLGAERDRLAQALQESETARATLAAERDQAQQEAHRQTNALKVLQVALDTERQHATDQEADARSQIAAGAAERDAAEQAAAAAQAARARAEEESHLLEAQLDLVGLELARLSEAVAAAEASRDTAEAQTAQMQAAAAAQAATTARREAEAAARMAAQDRWAAGARRHIARLDRALADRAAEQAALRQAQDATQGRLRQALEALAAQIRAETPAPQIDAGRSMAGMETLAAALAEAAARQADRTARIAAMDRELAALRTARKAADTARAAQDAQTARLTQAEAEAQLRITALAAEIDRTAAEAGTARTALAEAQARLDALTATLTQRDRRLAAERRLTARVLLSQGETAAELDRETRRHAQTRATAAARGAEATALKTALAEADHRLRDLLSSRSWRLSAPVRVVGRLLQRGRSGGMRNT